MKKTSLTRALFVAGVMAVAGGMAQADAIFYPDGTHVNLGEHAVESGLANAVLARSPSTAPSSTMLAALGVTADQGQIFASNPMVDDTAVATAEVNTTTLGAGPTVTTTTTTTMPVYVFPNIDWDRSTVLSQPHPMMSSMRSMPGDRWEEHTAAATFNTPTRAGEASTMTSGAPNLLTTNESVATLPAPVVTDTTVLGAGPITWGSSNIIDPNTGSQHRVAPTSSCSSNNGYCEYLPD